MSARHGYREAWLRDFTAMVVALLAAAAVVLATSAHAQGAPAEGGINGVTSTTTTVTFSLPALLPSGSASAPSLSFADDLDTGLYRAGADQIGFVTGAIERFRIGTVEVRNILGVFWNTTYRDASGNQRLFFGATSTNVYTGQSNASGTAHSFESQTTLTSGKIASFKNDNGSTERAAIDYAGKGSFNGGVDINTTTAKPTCNSSARGTIWVTEGGAGVADIIEKCLKDAADAYAWSAL